MAQQISRREFVKRMTMLSWGAAVAAACSAPAGQGTTQQQPPAGATTAAQPAAAVPPQGGSITWLEWWGNEWGQKNLQFLNDGFTKKTGIKVDMTDVAYTEMQPKLQAAALAGQGWDVFGTEGGSWIINWEKLGFAEDLTPWLAKSGAAFNDRLTDMTKVMWKGKPMMLYLYLIPFNLAYDATRFKQMGLEPPKNWEDFFKAAEAFKKKGEYGFGYSLRTNSTQFIGKMWNYRLAQAGGRILDKDGQVVFNKEPGVIATEWWKRFYQANLTFPGSETENPQTTTENIATGKIAMAIDGPYIRTTARQLNPNADIRWAPAWKAETGGYNWGGSGIGIWAKGQKKEQAWKFIEHFFSDEVMVTLAKEVNLPFAVKSVFKQDWLKDDPMLHAIPAMQQQDPANSWSSQPFPEGAKLYQLLSETVLACMKGEKTNIKASLDEVAGVWQKTIDDAKKAS